MSGVVSPVVTCSSLVVTPSVPMLADGCPAIRQSCRVSSTVEVLPLVPVTATSVSGNGAKKLRGEPGEFAVAARPPAMWTAPSTFASGRATTAIAPGRHRVGDEILAVETRARESPEHRAGRDLAMIDGEAGDALLLVTAGQRAEAHQSLRAGDQRPDRRRVDVAAGVGDDAEQRADARDHPADDRRRGPGGGGRRSCWPRSGAARPSSPRTT